MKKFDDAANRLNELKKNAKKFETESAAETRNEKVGRLILYKAKTRGGEGLPIDGLLSALRQTEGILNSDDINSAVADLEQNGQIEVRENKIFSLEG